MSELIVPMNLFKPRDYQKPLIKAMLHENYKRAICVWSRRSGKDITAFNIVIRKALKEVGTYFYVFPTFASGRRILWDAITNDGVRVLDYLPDQLVEGRNEAMMRIKMVNGSVIQIVGSDRYDKVLVGTNAKGIIFSEFALQDPMAYKFSIPIVSANEGFMLFISTPRGKNHMYEIFQIAKKNPDHWFTSHLTVEDTGHIPLSKIEEQIEHGELSRELALQEYWCDWDLGLQGTFYGAYMNTMRLEGRIGTVLYDPTYEVHTAWDLGLRDACAIVLFQYINNCVYVIDCIEDTNKGLDHYVKLIKSKPYNYGIHIAPPDIQVREFSSGRSRLEIAKSMGIVFKVLKMHTSSRGWLADGIEVVRTVLPRTYINESTASRLVTALDSYRKEWDPRYNRYREKPVHDEFSHMADAFRYLSLGLKQLKKGMTKEEAHLLNRQGRYGTVEEKLPIALQSHVPQFYPRK